MLRDDGLILLLLPGLDGTGTLFRNFVAALGSRVETEIVSYPVDQPLGYADLEARVRAILPKNRRFAVLGESFSGPIAIRIGADSPQGLVGLVLCVTFAKNPQPLLAWTKPWTGTFPVKGVPGWLKDLFMGGSRSSQAALHEVELATAAVNEEVLQHRIGAVLAVDETEATSRIQVPTLILQASDDLLVPRAATAHLLAVLPKAKFVQVEGSHLLLQSRPHECAAAVIRFLEKL